MAFFKILFWPVKRKQTNTNEHETKTNEQGEQTGNVRRYPEEAPPASFVLLFASPLFFLANFLTTDAGMITKRTPRYRFSLT